MNTVQYILHSIYCSGCDKVYWHQWDRFAPKQVGELMLDWIYDLICPYCQTLIHGIKRKAEGLS